MSENSYERYTFSHDLSRIFGKSRVKMCNFRNCFLTMFSDVDTLSLSLKKEMYTSTVIKIRFKNTANDIQSPTRKTWMVSKQNPDHNQFSLIAADRVTNPNEKGNLSVLFYFDGTTKNQNVRADRSNIKIPNT